MRQREQNSIKNSNAIAAEAGKENPSPLHQMKTPIRSALRDKITGQPYNSISNAGLPETYAFSFLKGGVKFSTNDL